MFEDRLKGLITKHEGLRLVPYYSNGKLHIGVGRNLEEMGISKAEAMMMLTTDIGWVTDECEREFQWFDALDDPRRAVIMSMVFNMGMPTFRLFRQMIAAMARQDYMTASLEMLKSEWAQQVGSRALELAAMMKDGVWNPIYAVH